MFNEWSYNEGLGDCASDVTAGLATDYVYAGSLLRYQARVFYGAAGGLQLSYQDEIVAAAAARGYRNVSVDGPSLGLWTIGQGTVVITVRAPIDQASKEDVRTNLDGAIGSANLNVASSSISFVSKPSVTDVCGGSARSSAEREAPVAGEDSTGKRGSVDKDSDACKSKKGLDWLKCEAGIDTTTMTLITVGLGLLIASRVLGK